MCVIYSCSAALPSEEELHRGAFRNDDGSGIAWLEKFKGKDVVYWHKGLFDEKEVLKFIEKEKLAFPLAIHFRTASVGGKCEELCHPFPLSDSVETASDGCAEQVLLHNGHVGNWEDLVLRAALGGDFQVPEGEWSDTRALAWLTWLKGPGIIPFIAGSSRVLLFHAEPTRWKDCGYDRATDHFTHFGSWVEHGKEGWSQSITTDWGGTVVRGGRFRGNEHYFGQNDDDDLTDSRAVACSAADKLNIWTVSELRGVLEGIEKDLDNARIAAGV